MPPASQLVDESAMQNRRRSLRLSKPKGVMVVELEGRPQTKRRKIRYRELPDHAGHASASACLAASIPGRTSTSSKPRSQMLALSAHTSNTSAFVAEIKRDKDILLERARELELRMSELEQRIDVLKQREEEYESRAPRTLLEQLEDQFSCALCYEVLACPYTLAPAECGHTFCALCVLKWFLSRVHQTCGNWHESVDCPICRSSLTLTPSTPRTQATFPFTPNRVLDSFLRDSLGKLAHDAPAARSAAAPIKSGKPSARIKQESVVAENVKRESVEEPLGSQRDQLTLWRDGGALRAEWQKRDGDGRMEMRQLLASWATLEPADFLLLKARLAV